MHITFYRRPCLYPDATELFYAYVNGTPAKNLAFPGPCALPKSVMESMMQEACAGVDPADEQVRFYFEPFPLPKYGSSSYTCVARLLAFTYSDWSSPDAEHCVSSMQAAWPLERMQRERIVFSGIAPYRLCFRQLDPEEPIPFANGLGQFPAPAVLKDRLLEVFSDYPSHISALSSMLFPIMKYLERALPPWIAKAEPLIAAWERHLQFTSAKDFIQKELCGNGDYEISGVTASLMFFHPQRLFFYYNQESKVLDLLIGAASSIPGQKTQKFANWEYTALRLLSSPLRMKMLYALRGKRCPPRKLSRKQGKSS